MSDYSLDSLTTPNQSPSPEPEQSALKTASSAATGLDSDSDLSELTEDEQEAEKQDGKNNNRNLDEDEDNDEDGSGRKRSSRRGRRKRGGLVPAPMWEWAKRKEPSSSPVPEEEEEENVDGIPQAMEEEEGEEEDEDDDDDDVPPVVARTSRGRANKPLDDDDDDEGPEAEEDVPEDEYMSDVEQSTLTAKTSARTVRADPSRLTASASNPRHPSNSNFDFDDDDDPLSDPPTGLPEDVTDYPNENELETESEDEEKDPAPAKLDLKTLPVVAETDLLPEIDLDVTAPSPMAVAPVAAAAAASSIMAGSFVIENPPSPSSSNSGSAASSRSASPMQEDAADRPSEGAKKRDSKATDMLPPPVIRKISDSAAGFDEEGEPVEVDEPSPDQELEMELESDLQPAHRAEALDSLAGIELKFARLRERLYVEKLEQLAWEETLVHEGNHPELIYLQTELTKRRDKRIELATRKRSYEVASINKRRRDEEEATWGWWKLARDELQTEMFTETNRKRRKLERERRAFDRPIQPRYIPPKPLYQIPPPPTLRQIVQESPFTSRRAQHAKKELQLPHFATPLVYPGLTSLPPTEIQGDLEYLFQHRRGPNPNPASMPHPAQTHPNPSQLAGYDQNYMVNGNSLPPQGGDVHGSNPPTFGGGGNRMPPPNFPSQHPVGHPPPGPLPGLPPFAGPGREQPFPTDYDMDASGSAMGSKVLPPPNNSYFGAAPSVGMNSGNGFMANPNGHLVLRRSSSPPLPSGQGDVREKQNGGWPGAKVEPQSHWAGELRRHEMDVDEREHRSKENRREKERARERSEWERSEREREREHAEMTRLMVAQEQRERDQHLQRDRHAPPPVQHPHLHGAPPTQHHHHHHHHHPDHHHHVVHHHHSVAPLINNGHQPPPPSVLPLSVPNGQSPRFGPSREFEGSRPHSRHHDRDPGILSLSNNKPGWKEESHAQEYREPRHRDRHGQSRPSSTRPLMEERERPSSSSASYGLTSSGPPNPGPSSQGNWNQNEDPSLRLPPPPLPAASGSGSYLGSVEGVGNSPGRRYSGGGRSLQPARQDSTTRSPPRPRPPQAVLSLGPGSSPSSSSAYPRSPMRHSGPPPPPSQPLNTLPPMSSSHTGTSPTHKIHRPHSPPHPSKNNLGGAGGYASPRFPGMSRTLTPTGMPPPLEPKSNPANGRTSPPSMPFPPPSLSTYQPPASLPPPPTRSSGGTASPRLPSQGKMAVAQMIDGH